MPWEIGSASSLGADIRGYTFTSTILLSVNTWRILHADVKKGYLFD